MIRDTSIEAYKKIKENGLLSRRKWQVYDILFNEGPLTQNEVWKRLTREVPGIQIRSVSPRFSELEGLGIASEVGRRECTVTKEPCGIWDVNSKLPIKFEKPKVHKCPTCKGTGKIEQSQAMLF